MKAMFLSDQFANLGQVTEQQRAWITPRDEMVNGEKKTSWVYAKGQVVDGPLALQIVRTGQGAPVDDECAKACGLSDEQLMSVQVEYEMTMKGIDNDEERALYRAGVISGFDDKHELVPGPNWDKYQEALKKKEATEV